MWFIFVTRIICYVPLTSWFTEHGFPYNALHTISVEIMLFITAILIVCPTILATCSTVYSCTILVSVATLYLPIVWAASPDYYSLTFIPLLLTILKLCANHSCVGSNTIILGLQANVLYTLLYTVIHVHYWLLIHDIVLFRQSYRLEPLSALLHRSEYNFIKVSNCVHIPEIHKLNYKLHNTLLEVEFNFNVYY